MTEDNTFLIFVKLMIGHFYYELPTTSGLKLGTKNSIESIDI